MTSPAIVREALVERLRAKRQVYPAQGGGTVILGGESSFYITDDGYRMVNPDGPAAAEEIERLAAALAALDATPGEGEQAIREKGQAEGFAAAVSWLRDRSAKKPLPTLSHAATILAEQMEQSRIPGQDALSGSEVK